MPLYFAYDEFMDPALATALVADIRVMGVGRLPRHRVIVGVDGHASLTRDPMRQVEGIVFDISLAGLRLWERRFRGVPKITQPIITTSGARRAIVHVPAATGGQEGDRRRLLMAARNAGLSDAYCTEIETGSAGSGRKGRALRALDR